MKNRDLFNYSKYLFLWPAFYVCLIKKFPIQLVGRDFLSSLWIASHGKRKCSMFLTHLTKNLIKECEAIAL